MYTGETGIYIAILSGIVVLLALMGFFIVTIVRYQRKKVAFHLQKVKEEFFNLDRERERIAIDLHDDLGASLSAIKLRLQCVDDMDTENIKIIEQAELQIDKAMQRLRQISFNMMPGVLQRRGLNEALKELIELMTDKTGISVHYQSNIDAFDKNRSLHIYRISQEILNNMVKHANATTVDFTITKIKNSIRLHIKDNGIGFNKNAVIDKRQGSGLRNIDSRAHLLNAKIFLTTSPGKGVDYLVEIPV
jgi:signal transduction histidine kinase